MPSIEQILEQALNEYLAVRGDRIATDAGLLTLREFGTILEADLDGERFDIVIRVRRVV